MLTQNIYKQAKERKSLIELIGYFALGGSRAFLAFFIEVKVVVNPVVGPILRVVVFQVVLLFRMIQGIHKD